MRETTRQEYARRILLAQHAIEQDLDQPPAPRALAKQVAMAPHHFHRVFRGQTGESVMQYARRLRLERAARRLRTLSTSDILPIALEAGYQSHEAFTRAFAAAFGMPPSKVKAGEALGLEPRECPVPLAPPDEVRVERKEARTLLSMRHVGPYEEVPSLWGALHGYWATAKLLPEDAPIRQYGIVPDDPTVTDGDKLRYDAGIEVPAGLDPSAVEAPAALTEIPAGLYAIATHRGSYAQLHELYLSLIGAWFPQSGHVLDPAPTVEWYVNSPHDTAEADLVTEIWVRIEERGFLTSPA